jgi:hypothetical protein
MEHTAEAENKPIDKNTVGMCYTVDESNQKITSFAENEEKAALGLFGKMINEFKNEIPAGKLGFIFRGYNIKPVHQTEQAAIA